MKNSSNQPDQDQAPENDQGVETGFKLLAAYIKGFLTVVWACVKVVAHFLWVITSGVIIYLIAMGISSTNKNE